MALNTPAQNPNTRNLVPASADRTGIDRGQCSVFEMPLTGNNIGDRILAVDDSLKTYVWSGTAWAPVDVGGSSSTVTLPKPNLIDAFADSADAGYTFSANTTVSTATGTAAGEGKIREVGNGTAVTMFARKIPPIVRKPSDMGVLAFMVNRESGSYNGAQLTMTRSGSTGGKSFTDSSTTFRKGRKWYAARQSELGTFPAGAAGTVQHQISVNQAAPYDVSAILGPLYSNAAGRPRIVLSFDDCIDNQYSLVFQMLQARKLRATFYIPSAQVGTANKMTVAQLQEMYAAGHDIGTNTTTDVSITSFASDALCVADLDTCKAFLLDNGMGRAVNHMALSNGVWSEARLAALQTAGMLTARTTIPQTRYTRFGHGDQAMTLPSMGFSGGTTLAQAIAPVDEAIDLGCTAQFHHHAIPGGWPLDLFTQWFDYIAAKRDAGFIDDVTISQEYSLVTAGAIGV